MEIDINRAAISFGDKYKVYVEGEQMYSAANELFRFLSKVNIYELGNDTAIITLDQKWAFFKPVYTITMPNNDKIDFITVSIRKLQYQVKYGKDVYDIYGHTGRKYSVFKNDTQIAYWEANAVNWFNGENVKIIADRNCDKGLLIALCLTLDDYQNKNNGRLTEGISIDFGNLVFGSREFDKGWFPK